MLRVLPLFAALVASGCMAPQPIEPAHAPPPSAPQPVALVDATIRALLQPCPIEPVRRFNGAEPTRVANARGAALLKCNQDKAEALRRLEHP